MSILDYNVSASLNTTIGGIYVGPNPDRADMDNAFRQLMADIAQLPSASGASLISFTPSGAGMTSIDLQTYLQSARVNIKSFGAVGDGVADDSAAFEKAFEAGGMLYIPDGTYLIKNRTTSNLTRHVDVLASGTASVVLDSAIGAQAFTIIGAGLYSFKWTGGNFSSTNVSNPSASGDVGSVFDLNTLAWGAMEAMNFIAGADYTAQKGDTAIDAVNCSFLYITRCRFVGWYDNAIYITGGNLTTADDDGGPTVISQCYFEKNGTAVAMKRRTRNVIISDCTFFRNYVDWGCYEVAAGEVQPADRFLVVGNISSGAVKAVGEVRGYGEFTCTGNTFRDWGYDLAEVVVGNPSAIILDGCRNTNISGNVVEMRDRTRTSGHVFVQIENYTVGATTYTASNNFINNNQVANTTYVIYEGAGVGPNYAMDNDFSVSVPTIYNLTNAASICSGLAGSGQYKLFMASGLKHTVDANGVTAPAFFVGANQVVGSQQAAIPDPSGGATVDTQARATLASVLGALRTHGLIDT